MLKKLFVVSAIALSSMTVAHAGLFDFGSKSQPPTPVAPSSYAGLVAGKDYQLINVDPTKTVTNPVDGKPLVIEFFWYGCPHCYHMEPMVKKMLAEHKGDITYKRYPVVFPRWDSGAKLYFTVEEMGLEEKLHDKIFYTIQSKNSNIMDDKKARDKFLQEEGIDVAKFDDVYNSFSINTKMAKAKAMVVNYKLDSSPTFVVNNTYAVNPALNGTYDNTMKTLELVIDKVKKEKK